MYLADSGGERLTFKLAGFPHARQKWGSDVLRARPTKVFNAIHK